MGTQAECSRSVTGACNPCTALGNMQPKRSYSAARQSSCEACVACVNEQSHCAAYCKAPGTRVMQGRSVHHATVHHATVHHATVFTMRLCSPCDCSPCNCSPCDCSPCDCSPCDCVHHATVFTMRLFTMRLFTMRLFTMRLESYPLDGSYPSIHHPATGLRSKLLQRGRRQPMRCATGTPAARGGGVPHGGVHQLHLTCINSI